MKLLPVACLCLLTLSGKTSVVANAAIRLVVKEDSDVILPCSLSTKENIESKVFDWKKAAQKDVPQKEVFMYVAGANYNNGREGQSEQFKGRVFHFQEELKHGNASIIIKKAEIRDSGTYTCVFPRVQPEKHIELIVAPPILKVRKTSGASPQPYVTTLDHSKDGVLLQCVVQGAFPKPELQWRDSTGNNLTGGELQVYPRQEKDVTRYNVTLQIRVTTSGYFRCVATQLEIYHQVTSDEVSVQLIVKPVYTVVTEGNDVILPCSIDTKKTIEAELFIWRKHNQEVFLYNVRSHSNNGHSGQSEQFKGRVFHFPEELKHGNASIIIRNTNGADSGDYTCEFPRLQPQRQQVRNIQLVVAARTDGPSGISAGVAVGVGIGGLLVGAFIGVIAYKCCNKTKDSSQRRPGAAAAIL